jgi:hypothetical protein
VESDCTAVKRRTRMKDSIIERLPTGSCGVCNSADRVALFSSRNAVKYSYHSSIIHDDDFVAAQVHYRILEIWNGHERRLESVYKTKSEERKYSEKREREREFHCDLYYSTIK